MNDRNLRPAADPHMAPASARRMIGDDLLELADVARAAAADCGDAVAAYARIARDTLRSGGTLLFCGNGGSAADAQHLAAEYVVRFSGDRRAFAALALTTDTSVLTACANDLGYDEVFARQVEALGRPGDLVVMHSTSGESANLVRAAAAARAAGIRTVAVLARGAGGGAGPRGGRLRALVDTAVVVPTERAARAQEVQLAIGHAVCRYVENSLGTRTPANPHEPGAWR